VSYTRPGSCAFAGLSCPAPYLSAVVLELHGVFIGVAACIMRIIYIYAIYSMLLQILYTIVPVVMRADMIIAGDQSWWSDLT